MKNKDNYILCIGELLWDVIRDERKPGGAPMNVALHLHKLEHQVHMVSRIGRDHWGKELLNFVSATGLSCSQIQEDPDLPTSEVLVQLDENNNASYRILEPVAWDHLEYTPDLKQLADGAKVIIYGTLGSRNPEARSCITRVLESNAIKVIDVNLRPPHTRKEVIDDLLGKADIAKLNEEELQHIAGWVLPRPGSPEESMAALAGHYNLRSVVLTRGGDGAIYYDGKTFHEHPGYKVRVADTVGAGDAFLAGLVSSILMQSSPGEALDFASGTGALVASRRGATPDYQISDIQKLIQ